MNDEPYSNRELDAKYQTLLDKCDSIIVQTTKHNGRLSTLEKFMWTIGGITMVMLTIVIPMLTFYIGNVENRISKIEDIFTTYNIEIQE